MNWPLFIFDYVVCLPFTIIRLFIIYFFGSRYNINGYKFLDAMTHASNPYFNKKTNDEHNDDSNNDNNISTTDIIDTIIIDTIDHDVRTIIKSDTKNDYVGDIIISNETDVSITQDTKKSEIKINNLQNVENINNIGNIDDADDINDTELELEQDTVLDTDAANSDDIELYNIKTSNINNVNIGILLENVVQNAFKRFDTNILNDDNLSDQLDEQLDEQLNEQLDNQSDDQTDALAEITTTEFPPNIEYLAKLNNSDDDESIRMDTIDDIDIYDSDLSDQDDDQDDQNSDKE